MIASIEPGRRKIRRSNGAIDYPFYERRMKRLRRLALQRLLKRLKAAISRHGNPRPQYRPVWWIHASFPRSSAGTHGED